MSNQKVSPIDADFANIFFKPIAGYLSNPETAEVMVNGHDDIWIEDDKGLWKAPESFSPDALLAAVNSLAQYVGRPIIENVFSIDARMPDGSRVCIVLPPVSGKDPIFAIRKFKEVVSDLDFLVKKKTLTVEMVEFIDALVKVKKNMMVSGGTSSGKTTLLNLIAAKIPDHDRIITIEDSRELQLKQDHVLPLEARPADKHGKGEFSIRQCLKSSLRLRPDRIIVGEIRSGEAFDLIQAMNTGHGGCMGTVHANTPTDTLRRIESLALTADIDMPLVALRSMIASALDVIICPARLSDGSRRIVQIAEIGPLTEKGDYQTYDIIRYVSTHRDKDTGKLFGYFEFTGHIPSFYDMFEAEGVHLPLEFFRKRIIGDVPAELIPKLRTQGYELPGDSRNAKETTSTSLPYNPLPSQIQPQTQDQTQASQAPINSQEAVAINHSTPAPVEAPALQDLTAFAAATINSAQMQSQQVTEEAIKTSAIPLSAQLPVQTQVFHQPIPLQSSLQDSPVSSANALNQINQHQINQHPSQIQDLTNKSIEDHNQAESIQTEFIESQNNNSTDQLPQETSPEETIQNNIQDSFANFYPQTQDDVVQINAETLSAATDEEFDATVNPFDTLDDKVEDQYLQEALKNQASANYQDDYAPSSGMEFEDDLSTDKTTANQLSNNTVHAEANSFFEEIIEPPNQLPIEEVSTEQYQVDQFKTDEQYTPNNNLETPTQTGKRPTLLERLTKLNTSGNTAAIPPENTFPESENPISSHLQENSFNPYNQYDEQVAQEQSPDQTYTETINEVEVEPTQSAQDDYQAAYSQPYSFEEDLSTPSNTRSESYAPSQTSSQPLTSLPNNETPQASNLFDSLKNQPTQVLPPSEQSPQYAHEFPQKQTVTAENNETSGDSSNPQTTVIAEILKRMRQGRNT